MNWQRGEGVNSVGGERQGWVCVWRICYTTMGEAQ